MNRRAGSATIEIVEAIGLGDAAGAAALMAPETGYAHLAALTLLQAVISVQPESHPPNG
jgi:hypothetical protein